MCGASLFNKYLPFWEKGGYDKKNGGFITEFVIKQERGWVTCYYYKETPYYLVSVYFLGGLITEIFFASTLYLVPYTRGIGGIYFVAIGLEYLFGYFKNDLEKAGLSVLNIIPFRICVLISFLTLCVISLISYFRFFEKLE